MFKFFKTKRQIHEPDEAQIKDLSHLEPFLQDKILNGSSCDEIENAFGKFGTLNNPIPVNGPMGLIKYLGKLRGKTGFGVFFSRFATMQSEITLNPIDGITVVCFDTSQMQVLYFDIYHPRRSNFVPEGFTLLPYDKKLKMDMPFGYGVLKKLKNFPNDIPREIDAYYGSSGVYGKHAQKLLDELYLPNIKLKAIPEDVRLVLKKMFQESKEKSAKFISESQEVKEVGTIIKDCILAEKEILKNRSSELFGFENGKLFEELMFVRFYIERFVFLTAYTDYRKVEKFAHPDVLRHIVDYLIDSYNINEFEAKKFLIERKKFYLKELDMLGSMKNPHPGKIFWALQNPGIEYIDHTLDNKFEENIFAAMILIEIITRVFDKYLKKAI